MCVCVQASCEPLLPERLFETDGEEEHSPEKTTAAQLATEDEAGRGEEMREEEGEEEKMEAEEEGGEGERDTASSSGKYSGLGLGSLLRVSEYSSQNHGSVTVDLNVPWSRLLSPLPHESPPPSLARWAESQTPSDDEEGFSLAPSPLLSLEHYLQICERHMSMSEADRWYSSAVYHAIDQRGERGISEEGLRESLPPLPSPPSISSPAHSQRPHTVSPQL